MTICDLCDQEMTTADSCSVTVLHDSGRPVPAIPYGSETGWTSPPARCHDCGVRRGGYHHVGCDTQECPRCRRQLITCDCPCDELPRPDEHEDRDRNRWEAESDQAGRSPARPNPAAGAPVGPSTPWRPTSAPTPGVVSAPPHHDAVPLATAAAPLRARHHQLVGEVAAWALANGRSCDLDVAAACVECLLSLGDDRFCLTRPQVSSIVSTRMWNWATIAGTALPEDWMVHLWTVLCAIDANARLGPDSDPLPALLEPLQCYGGLGSDGLPLPSGTDVSVACQCYLRHDPTLPEGMGRHVVGFDPVVPRQLLVVAHLQPRSVPTDPSDWMPWLTFTERLTACFEVFSTDEARFAEATFVGRVPVGTRNPELWLYRPFDRTGEPGPLALDHDGRPYVPRPDRRYKVGYRWVTTRDVPALMRAGLLAR